jgi:Holliday junction resolvase RusA-like endonuclease
MTSDPMNIVFAMTCVTFVVPGTPVGKGRPKFARRGAFVSTYTPEKTASYENLVKLAASRAMGGAPLIETAVTVQMMLFVTPPASWSARKRAKALIGLIKPTTKPDIDNVVKGVFDAMNDIVWKDDKQVTELSVTKRYADVARTEVTVWEWGKKL